MRKPERDQKTVLSVLAFLSTCQSERELVLQDKLQLPRAILGPSLKALAAAEYILIEPVRLEGAHADSVIEITSLGRAYFLERVGHLKVLVDLLDTEEA